MTIRLLAFILSILFPTMAPAASGPNEPSGFTTLSDFNFDSRCANGWLCVWPSGQIVTDPSAPVSPPNIYQDRWANHSFSDIANPYYPFPPGTREFYMATWWKPSNPFYGWSGVTTQKLFLLEGSHTYLSMVRTGGGGASSTYTVAAYPSSKNNNCHVAQGVSCDMLNPNVSGITVPLGQWNRLEWYVRASTTASSRDGVIRWWLNNVLMGNYTNVNTEIRTFNTVMLTHVWDSVDPQQVTDYHQYDHVHLSVGSGGGGGVDNPPGPPNAPRITSVTAQ